MGISEALAELDKEFFGGLRVRFEALTPTLTVNTTATEVLPANPNRIAWTLSNKSTNPGHYDFERTVSSSQGFPISQNGGIAGMKYSDDGRTVQSAIFGVNETAGGTWYRKAWELY